MRRLLPAVMVTILSALLLVGCGNPIPDPEDVITRAQEAIEKVQTYRVEEATTVTQDEETFQYSFQMDLVLPDRMHETTVQGDGSRELIIIGQTEYYRHLDDGEWQVRQRSESSPPDNMAVTMVKSLDGLVGLIQMDDEKIDGKDCFHYKGIEGELNEDEAEPDPSQPGNEELSKKPEMYRKPQVEMEFWIGKEDYLLRWLRVSYTRDEVEENEKDKYQNNVINTLRFYDFDAPIQIEAPSVDLVEGVNLVANMRNMGDIEDDLEHYQVKYIISVSNQGLETAKDVRVFIESPATNRGLQTMEAQPLQNLPKSVDLGLGEKETYLVSWEYNLAASSKEKFIELTRQNVLRATWIGEKGQQHEDVLLEGN